MTTYLNIFPMKKCSGCKIYKESNCYHINKNRSDGLQSFCKSCNTVWVRKRYLRDKKYYDKKNKETKVRNQQFLLDHLLLHPCIDCGERDPVVLEFDHINKKTKNVTYMAEKMYCIKRIISEIDKCVIRCANCHRRKTAIDRNYYRIR